MLEKEMGKKVKFENNREIYKKKTQKHLNNGITSYYCTVEEIKERIKIWRKKRKAGIGGIKSVILKEIIKEGEL